MIDSHIALIIKQVTVYTYYLRSFLILFSFVILYNFFKGKKKFQSIASMNKIISQYINSIFFI